MRRIIIFLYICICGSFIAYSQQDSVQVHLLDEVSVTAENHQAIDYGIAYIPLESDKKHSSNYLDLLGQMMVPGLHVDVLNNVVASSWGGEVHYFIDGQEAREWEVKAIRLKDVVRVEFLLSPPDLQYKQYQSVINFVLRKYKYGGYVCADGSQGFINNNGNYFISSKLKKDKFTWQAVGEAFYRKADDITDNQTTEFNYGNGNLVNKSYNGTQSTDQRLYYGAVGTRFDSEKFLFIVDGGIQYSDKPHETEIENITFNKGGTESASGATTSTSSSNLIPYINGIFQLKGLSHNSLLYGGFSFSYNKNKQNSDYQLNLDNTSILNGYNENAYLPTVYLAWMAPIYRQNYLTVQAKANLEMYRTNYSGTGESFQKLNNYYYTLLAQYTHSFSRQWSGKVVLSLPIQSVKVNDDDWNTNVFINGNISVNGRIGTKHSFFAQFAINQSYTNPAYYNTVVRQDTELEGAKGNADLKTVRQAYALLSYTWMPVNVFSLNASVQWDNIINDIVPWWHPEGDLMVKEMVNSGDFNPLQLSLSPAVSLFGKLNISAKLAYIHEWHNGLYHVNSGYFGIYPNISYKINSHFLGIVGYRVFNWQRLHERQLKPQ